ncbi:hypothetical protein PHYC_01534 [Phycisphaerales bacterium]|nr:hypothetical protein PHYC_01534 [Phycisphaerales bacterium]
MNRIVILVGSAAVLALGGCATHSSRQVVTQATPEQQKLLFDQVKSLAGTWEMADDHGKKQTAAVFTVSSNGSIVREVMFPGEGHEMTNIYHMDGPTLVVTHYCAQGNQPRMRAAAGQPGAVAFRLDSVTNLTAADEMYMGELTLVLESRNKLREEWKSFSKGEVQKDHCPVFELTRAK